MRGGVLMFSEMIKIKKNRFCVCIITFILILNFSISYSYSQSSTKTELRKEKAPGIKEYSLEFLGATVGEVTISAATLVLTAIPLTLLAPHMPPDAWGIAVLWGMLGYTVGGATGAYFGTNLTGEIMHEKGSLIASCVGGILGTYLGNSLITNSTGFALLPRKYIMPTPKIKDDLYAIIVAFILPPLGAVTGYNLFRSKNVSQSSIFWKNLPSFTLHFQPGEHGLKSSSKFGMGIIIRW